MTDELSERQVNFNLLPLPACVADRTLLKVVLTNLLSNALKFTAHRRVAQIEIGASIQVGEPCYYIRDNGAGFDMRYSGKLFGVFERLHRVDEFDGIGIGLAIAKRILLRHGGRIWAEAEIEKGATFYFTLG